MALHQLDYGTLPTQWWGKLLLSVVYRSILIFLNLHCFRRVVISIAKTHHYNYVWSKRIGQLRIIECCTHCIIMTGADPEK